MWDSILLQASQLVLVDMFMLSQRIKLNMVEEKVVTIGFNKNNQHI
jgi:hypothetical protein